MMFDRHIIQEFRNWSEKKERKPLVLRGARQVGKTSAVQLFGKEFDVFIHLNLEKPEHKNIFETDYTFEELVNRIFFHTGQTRHPGRVLVFIDEIQNSPKAVSLLRYFYEEANDLYVIAAGSLLENLLDRKISFPVGRVEFMFMQPCTFREFLLATGEQTSLTVYDQADIPGYAHDKMMSLFRRYALIGGMPEIVNHYAENMDITALSGLCRQLLISFSEDVEKYSRSDSMEKYIRHIISVAFQHAGTRITFEKFGNSSYRSREIKEAFLMLERTMILKLIYPITSTRLPLIPNLRKKPRLHLLDTGLVNHALGIAEELITKEYLDDVYRGKIAEHIVGQELLGLSHQSDTGLGFWVREKNESSAEVDYIFAFKGYIIPVEVKSGPSGKLRSLHQFVKESPHHWAVRFYSGKFSLEETRTPEGKRFQLINLPLFMAGKLPSILNAVIH